MAKKKAAAPAATGSSKNTNRKGERILSKAYTTFISDANNSAHTYSDKVYTDWQMDRQVDRHTVQMFKKKSAKTNCIENIRLNVYEMEEKQIGFPLNRLNGDNHN